MTDNLQALQAQPDTSQIEDFRKEHSDALMDGGHPEHDRRTRELTALFETHFPETPLQQADRVADPNAPVGKSPLEDAAAEAMRPLSAEEFPVGIDTDFGVNIDTEKYGWDTQLETDARQSFARASLNEAQALTVARAYADTLEGTHDTGAWWRQATTEIGDTYGRQNVERIVDATNRMIRDLADKRLRDVLVSTGLGAHPSFVSGAVRFAKQRGYFR